MGTILSSPYPHVYENNLNLEWTITTDISMQLSLRFIRFELEDSTACQNDYLLVSVIYTRAIFMISVLSVEPGALS